VHVQFACVWPTSTRLRPDSPGRCGHGLLKKYLGQSVDLTVAKTDKYGRYLAEIRAADGTYINQASWIRSWLCPTKASDETPIHLRPRSAGLPVTSPMATTARRLRRHRTRPATGHPFCSKVKNQKTIGSCTAHGGTSTIEYVRRKSGLKTNPLSRLMYYYGERSYEHTPRQDSGAQVRDGIKFAVKVACARKRLWPYIISKFS
jgi:hypothetical protein